jgi:hypothetical protein
VRRSALKQLVDAFYDGSMESVVDALLGLEGSRLSQKRLDRIAAMIEKARKETKRMTFPMNCAIQSHGHSIDRFSCTAAAAEKVGCSAALCPFRQPWCFRYSLRPSFGSCLSGT